MNKMEKNKNLSKDRLEREVDYSSFHIGIVVSEWNEPITGALLEGCKTTLLAAGVPESNIHVSWVPGAFELPLGAKMLAGKEKLDGLVCLGCVIKGDTRHDEYINAAVSQGIMQLSLVSGKPVTFGLLTVENEQQALDRAGGKHGNKGDEAAQTVLRMIRIGKEIKEQKSSIGF
jgi:6,7-dimethyl-8-ribityllumazine synthase